MKSFFNYLGALVIVATAVIGCKKDETRVTLMEGGTSMLTVSVPTLELIQDDASEAATSLTWTAPEYGFNAAVNYTIQFAKAGENFPNNSNTATVNVGTANQKNFKVGELNGKLLEIIPFGSPQQVEVRVKASLAENVTPIYSNVVTMTVTAYRDIIVYEFPQALRVAGNHQGWNPGEAPKIVDKNASGTTGEGYEGYINFTDPGAPQFKLVKGPQWSDGDFGSSGPGVLTNGGNNVTFADGPGVYLLKANTVNMTFSGTKITTFGIIGDATPGGWGASTPMTFNAAAGTWTITTNLVGGKELKFRANDDWAINYGDNGTPDNKPDPGGSNIRIADDGNYTITLDLGVAGNYAYSIRKN